MLVENYGIWDDYINYNVILILLDKNYVRILFVIIHGKVDILGYEGYKNQKIDFSIFKGECKHIKYFIIYKKYFLLIF